MKPINYIITILIILMGLFFVSYLKTTRVITPKQEVRMSVPPKVEEPGWTDNVGK